MRKIQYLSLRGKGFLMVKCKPIYILNRRLLEHRLYVKASFFWNYVDLR